MKDEKQLFAIFALTLSLDIPLLELFLQAVFNYENEHLSTDLVQLVANESELISALSNSNLKRIKLDADIILFNDLVFNHDVVLDLGGHKLASLTAGARVIDIKCGCVTITGKGSIVANGLGAAAVRIKGAMTADNVSYSGLLIDEDVTLYAPNYYGLFLTPNCQAAYGVEVAFKGSMIARDGFCINGNIQGRGENAPKISLLDGARIIVDENDGIAVYAPGFGRWEIGAVEIIGATGVGACTGKFNFSGATIVATGAMIDSSEWAETMASSGAVFQINNSNSSAPTFKIRSGEYISRQGYVFSESQALDDSDILQFKLQGGDFVGVSGIFENFSKRSQTLRISGGNFSSNISGFLSSDFRLEYDRSAKVYRIYNCTKPSDEPSPAAMLENARLALRRAISEIKFYLTDDYAGDELGSIQSATDKALATIKRAKTAAEKLLNNKSATIDQIENLIRRLAKAKAGIQTVEDDLRAEIMSTMAAARALDPADFSRYSFQILMESVEDADILLVQKQVSLFELYSAFCDVNMNLELLDDPEEGEELEEAFAPHKTSSTLVASTAYEEIAEEVAGLSAESNLAEAAKTPADDFDVSRPVETSHGDLLSDAEITIQTTAILGALALAETAPFNHELEHARANLRSLLNAITVLNPSDYTIETYHNLHELVVAASALLNEPDQNLSVDLLHSTYQQVDFAYLNLAKKSHDPVLRALDEARENLYSVLEVVTNLELNDYETTSAEQFGELQVAIAKANVILQNPNIKLEEIVAVMEEIQLATSGLKGATATTPAPVVETAPAHVATKPAARPVVDSEYITSQTTTPQPEPTPVVTLPSIDWSALREVLSDISALNPDDYSTESYNRLLSQLEYTKSVSDDPRLTQTIVDDIVFELNLSVLALERITTPNNTSVYEDAILPIAESSNQPSVAPNLLMSMMAGAYAGLATYRRSRIAAKHRK